MFSSCVLAFFFLRVCLCAFVHFFICVCVCVELLCCFYYGLGPEIYD